MRILVQYDSHLTSVNIQIHETVGIVYEKILNELQITSEKVVNMYHDNIPLGLAPSTFDANVRDAKLKSDSIIFVILNHYPIMTQLRCQTQHSKYLQWKNRFQVPYDIERITYDPVLPPSTLPSTTLPISSPLPVSSPLPISSPLPTSRTVSRSLPTSSVEASPAVRLLSNSTGLSSPQTSLPPARVSLPSIPPSLLSLPTTYDPGFLRGLSNLSSPHRPTSSSVAGVSNSLATNLRPLPPQTEIPSSRFLSPPRSTLSELTQRLATRRYPDSNYMLYSQLPSVPIVITAQQFNQLPRQPYRQVRERPNETSYDRCPILQEMFQNDEIVVILPCCSRYCSETGLRNWLTEQSSRCPCCNADVREHLSSQSRPTSQEESKEDDEEDDLEDDGEETEDYSESSEDTSRVARTTNHRPVDDITLDILASLTQVPNQSLNQNDLRQFFDIGRAMGSTSDYDWEAIQHLTGLQINSLPSPSQNPNSST